MLIKRYGVSCCNSSLTVEIIRKIIVRDVFLLLRNVLSPHMSYVHKFIPFFSKLIYDSVDFFAMSCISSRDAIKPPCHFCGQTDTIISRRNNQVRRWWGRTPGSKGIPGIHVNSSTWKWRWMIMRGDPPRKLPQFYFSVPSQLSPPLLSVHISEKV